MDVIVCCIELGMVCVSVLFFCNGISLGMCDFFFCLLLDVELVDVLV